MHLIQFDIRYQFQSFLCRKGTETTSGDRMGGKKTLGETRLSRGTSSPMTNDQTVYDYDSEYDPVPSG